MAGNLIKRLVPGMFSRRRPSRAIDPATNLPRPGFLPAAINLEDNQNGDWVFWFDSTGRLRYTDFLTYAVATFDPQGSATAGFCTVLPPNLTVAGNGADTTEDNMQLVTLPQITLPNAVTQGFIGALNRGIYICAWGAYSVSADSVDLRLYFGATVVASALAQTQSGGGWFAEAYVFRTGAGAQIAFGSVLVAATQVTPLQTTPAELDTGAIVVKTTGKENTAATANRITSKVLIVQGF